MGRTAKARYRRRRRQRPRFVIYDIGHGFKAMFDHRTRITAEMLEAMKEMAAPIELDADPQFARLAEPLTPGNDGARTE